MTDPQTERLLREYLLADAKAKASGITLERVYGLVQTLADDRLEDRKTRREDQLAVARYGRRLRRVEEQLSIVSDSPDNNATPWRPDPREVTGTHDFAVLKAQHDAEVADKRQWSQTWRGALLAAAFAAVLAAVSGCVGYAVSHLK